jgi:hypothetical protein
LRELLCAVNGYTTDAKVSRFLERLQNADPAGRSIHALAPTIVPKPGAVP